MELKVKYWSVLSRIETLPKPYKIITKNRFLLLKEFTDSFEKEEQENFQKKYRRKATVKKFCKEKGISVTTFYRWESVEKKDGIEGLIPHYGVWGWENENIAFIETSTQSHKGKSIVVKISLNLQRPLSFLPEIKELILNRPEIDQRTKHAYNKLLNYIVPFLKRKFLFPQKLTLSKREILRLESYRIGTHKNHSIKAKAILMAHSNHSLFEIVVATGRSKTTIYRWLRQFRGKGLDFIETKMDTTKKKRILNERTQRIIEILHSPPSNYDINRTSWTYDTLIQAYQQIHGDHLSKGIMQRVIKNTRYTWRHARRVLTSNDPDYKKKVAKVLKTLRNVKKNEAFFFVDELGPYKVKAYGGKSLTPKGVTKTISQYPKIKGEVQAIAALEAFTNQLTWEFTADKNSETIVVILDILRKKYQRKTKLYITWDEISSHRSSHVQGWVKAHNIKIKKDGVGPSIQIVPLPSKAQFLNVIESVFGGMKKAVIENSDYASKTDMEAAIDRHFAERNIFYELNPKRAGNKIWGEQAFKVEELPGGLFKKM